MDLDQLVYIAVAATVELVLCLMCSVRLWTNRKEGDTRSRVILAASSFCCVLTSLAKLVDLELYGFEIQYAQMFPPVVSLLALFCQLVLFCYPLEVMRPGWLTLRRALLLFSPCIVLAVIYFSGMIQFRPYYTQSEWLANAFEPDVLIRGITALLYLFLGLILLLIPYSWRNSSADRKWLLQWAMGAVAMSFLSLAFQWTHILVFHCVHQVFIGLFYLYFTHYELNERLLPTPNEVESEGNGYFVDPGESLSVPESDKVVWGRIQDELEAGDLWKDVDLNLSLLSRRVYSNRTYVSRAFRDNTGLSFAEYIKHKRIDYVADQLSRNPNQNIKNLFFDAGYRSYTTAWRQFQELKGVTPSEYAASFGRSRGGAKAMIIR